MINQSINTDNEDSIPLLLKLNIAKLNQQDNMRAYTIMTCINKTCSFI